MDHVIPGQPNNIDNGMDGHLHHHAQILDTLNHCEAVCEHMSTMLKAWPDCHMRQMQARYVRDCADICTLTAKYIARESCFSRMMAHLCAHICEMCGNECAKYSDHHSQHCAQVCLHCAMECRAYAMDGMEH